MNSKSLLFVAAATTLVAASPALAVQVQLDLRLRVDSVQVTNRADFLTPGSDAFDPTNSDLLEIEQFLSETPGLELDARIVFDSEAITGAGGVNGIFESPVFTPMRIIDPNGGEGINNGPAGYQTSVLAVDDVDIGVDDVSDPRDAVAFTFSRPYSGPSSDTAPDEASLFIVGTDGWFETQDMPLGDLEANPFILGGGFEARLVQRGGDENETLLYDEEIFGSIIGATLTPLGGSEQTPILPDAPMDAETPTFEFVLDDADLPDEGPLWIDPFIAVGYDYAVDGKLFESVTAPSLAAVPDGDGLYELTACGRSDPLAAGETIFFDIFCSEAPGYGVDAFAITGIDLALALDPLDTEAFVTGVTFVDDPQSQRAGFTVTQTPRQVFVEDGTAAVPLPAAGWLLLAGIGGMAAVRRRR